MQVFGEVLGLVDSGKIFAGWFSAIAAIVSLFNKLSNIKEGLPARQPPAIKNPLLLNNNGLK